MKKLDITKYKIKNKKIDKNLKLLFLSDLHNRNIVDDLIYNINQINPDIIIMGGDMVNQDLNDMNNYYELCKRLNNRIVYYTFGNHEEMLNENDRYEYMNNISKYNLQILNDDSVNLSKNIVLYGLESDIECYKRFHKSGSVFLPKWHRKLAAGPPGVIPPSRPESGERRRLLRLHCLRR